MADSKLVLHPVDAWAILQDPGELQRALGRLGLIAAGFSHLGDVHYRTGSRFAELVVFGSGAPPSGPGACHVSIQETTERPAYLGASNALPPKCPACHTAYADWKQQLIEWSAAPQRYGWVCGRCGKRSPTAQLEWGDTGGLARYSVEVWNVGPRQATPSAELMAYLEAETFTRWRYFYYLF